MSGYVDIHAHVIPGIDDGPADTAASLEMLSAAAASGVAAIAATPHLRPDFPRVHVGELGERSAALRDACSREGIAIELIQAAEVSVTWALDASAEELVLASYGQRGHDLLIETPSANILGLDRMLGELRTAGYRVTLAHPERSAELRQNESMVRALVEQGVLLQVNAESLLGPHRSAAHRSARELCLAGLAVLLASDGHRADRWRPVTRLAASVGAAGELLGADRARWMASAAGRAIVDGTDLTTPPDLAPRRRRRLFGRG